MEVRSKSAAAYLHQSEAIRELLGPTARSVVVTTGTGSGKTEAFLLPVIQNALEDAVRFKKSGLTAILIYPMNALANDQKLRIEEYLASAPSGLDFGVAELARVPRCTSDFGSVATSATHILSLDDALVRAWKGRSVLSSTIAARRKKHGGRCVPVRRTFC